MTKSNSNERKSAIIYAGALSNAIPMIPYPMGTIPSAINPPTESTLALYSVGISFWSPTLNGVFTNALNTPIRIKAKKTAQNMVQLP